jgi:predicted  nucleic acid-binding Zn-ribbon protein
VAYQRSAWTDERLDDLAANLDTSVAQLREEIHGLRSEMREEFRALRQDFSAMQRQIAQIGWGLAGTLAAALAALIISIG